MDASRVDYSQSPVAGCRRWALETGMVEVNDEANVFECGPNERGPIPVLPGLDSDTAAVEKT